MIIERSRSSSSQWSSEEIHRMLRRGAVPKRILVMGRKRSGVSDIEHEHPCVFELSNRGGLSIRLINGLTGYESWMVTDEFIESATTNGFFASLGAPHRPGEIYIEPENVLELFSKLGLL